MTKPTGRPRGRPRKDSAQTIVLDGAYENVFLGMKTTMDRGSYTRPVLLPILDQLSLDNLYISDGFARRIIDLPAEEMVRAGFCIEGIDDEKSVMSDLEGIQTLPKMCEALKWSSLYGGALVVMVINDGGEFTDDLNMNGLREIEALRVYDRHQVTRYQLYDDPADKRFGKTKLWQISPSNGTPYTVHESRCLIFDGISVPPRKREEYDGWGGSFLQHCNEQLKNYGLSHYWSNALMERAQQAVHGIPELSNTLRTKEGEKLVRQRVDLVDMARSINNTVVIDALESYDLKSTSLSGVSDIIDRFGMALSAVSSIPESLLFGSQPGGLNSTGKGDANNWYASIAQKQNTQLLPQIDRLVSIVLTIKNKMTDYLIKFNPLVVESKTDIAETDYKNAQTREIYYNMQSLDSSEVRTILKDEGYPIDDVKLEGEEDGDE